jgi:hypothetical protein
MHPSYCQHHLPHFHELSIYRYLHLSPPSPSESLMARNFATKTKAPFLEIPQLVSQAQITMAIGKPRLHRYPPASSIRLQSPCPTDWLAVQSWRWPGRFRPESRKCCGRDQYARTGIVKAIGTLCQSLLPRHLRHREVLNVFSSSGSTVDSRRGTVLRVLGIARISTEHRRAPPLA